MTKRLEDGFKQMKLTNDKLVEENQSLRKQLKLYHENCSLRAATVMSTLLAWLDSQNLATSPTYSVIKKIDDVIKNHNFDETQTTCPIGALPLSNVTGSAAEQSHTQDFQSSRDKRRKPPVGRNSSLTRVKRANVNTEGIQTKKQMGKKSSPQKKSPAQHQIEIRRSHPRHEASDSSDAFETDSLDDTSSSLSDQEVPRVSSGEMWTKVSTAKSPAVLDQTPAPTPDYSRVGPPVATSTPMSGGKSKDTATHWTVSMRSPEKHFQNKITPPVNRARPQKLPQGSDHEALEKFLNNARPNKRLLGEVAFQLDRRILSYIFSDGDDGHKRRFYGYIVQNIPAMVRRESVDPATGQLDPERQAKLRYRYDYVLNSLRPLGYDIDVHPEVTSDLVNRYGLLPVPVDKTMTELFSVQNKGFIEDYMRNITPRHELHNVLVLFDCLSLLAEDEGRPLFIW